MSTILKTIILAIFLIVFLIPGYTFFYVNSSSALLFDPAADSITKMYTSFRLLGLYAFTFVWGQIVLGPFLIPLTKLFGPIITKLHRTEGIFALTFATLHPLLFYTAYTLSTQDFFWNGLFNYLGAEYYIYGLMGVIAWIVMVCTVFTALFRNLPLIGKHWRLIHLLNYVIFILVFIHSYNIGSDVRTEPLNTLYGLFGLTFLIAVTYRIGYRRIWFRMFRQNYT